jgi:phenylpropionate dioxygenase-like ring-hydroxylating dioxygenase large terminal subunit
LNATEQRLREHWLIAATSKKLGNKPLACRVLDTPIVLFRSAGRASALLDRCSHRNAPLSSGRVVDRGIQCPYHGWEFDACGSCVHRPGTNQAVHTGSNVRSFAVREEHGFVWVRLANDGQAPELQLPAWWTDDAFQTFNWTSRIEADFVDGLENLLDATHTPFVHAGLVRSAKQTQTFRAKVRVVGNIAEVEYCDEGKQAGWVSRIFERDRKSSFGRFVPPCIAELEYTSSRGTEFVLNSHFVPEDPQHIIIYSSFFIRKSRIPMAVKRMLLSPFFAKILKQDRHILQLQQGNIERFGERNYQFWNGDVIRGLIEVWIRTGEFPKNHIEHTIELKL